MPVTYDAVDRLSSATNSGQVNKSYSYDAVGNRTASHLSATYGYQPFNKLTSSSSAGYSYDNNGNLISKTDASGTTTFVYDAENRLAQVALPNGLTVNYKYDPLGRRIQRTTSSGANQRYVYDGKDALADLNTDGSVATTYLSGISIDDHLRQTSSATGVSYFLGDHLGTTAGLTDASGGIVEGDSYDSFGNSSGSARTRYGYTGRERDPDTELLYYRARWYDPQVGRFVTEDPIGVDGGLNLYAYTANNPVLWNDALGLCPQEPLPKPRPAPAPTPTPAPPDPCRDRPWATILNDWRQIADWIGWRIKDTGKPGPDVEHQSLNQIEDSLAKNNFQPFPWYKPNLNFPEHGNGFHYEGQLRPNQWYHVVIHPTQDYPLIIPGDFRSRPASNIEIHCERGFLRPSSLHHAFDFIIN